MSQPDIPKRALGVVARYGLALVCVAVAWMATFVLQPDGLVTPLFSLAIILASWFGGMGPGLLAAMLSTVTISYFFLPPFYSFKFDLAHLPQLLVFFISAVLISSWSAVRRRAETLLRRARDEQEAKVLERTADLQAEITERLRVEETLRQRADLLDLTHDTVFVRDMNDVITYWNRGAEDLYGWNKQEAIGKTSHDLMHTTFPASLEEINETLFRTDRWEGELIHAKRDGARVVVASRWSLQRDGQGKPLAILETNNDVTERKYAEEALRRSEAYLAEAQRLSNTGSWARSVDSDELFYCSEELLRMFQLEPQPVFPIEETFALRIHPEDRERVLQRAREAMKRKTDYVSDFRILLPDGTLKYIQTISHPVVKASGEITEYIGTAMDVTERKHAEEELRESERRYRYIFHTAGVSIWEEDFSRIQAAIEELKSGGVYDFRKYLAANPGFVRQLIPLVKVSDVNDATLKLFKAKNKDELLVSLDKVFLPETEEVFAGELIALAEGRTSFSAETILQTLDGNRLTVLFSITFPAQPATLESVLVTIMDITERKVAEEELQKTRAELAHIARVTTMGELTSSIAHEVNQPLAAIVTSGNACLRWLSNDPPNVEEARDIVNRIVKDGHRASEVVSRIRAFFRKATPQRVRVNINQLIEDVIAMVPSELRRNRVQVRTELADNLPGVAGDQIQLQQVLLNLVVNAIEAMSTVNGPRELLIRSERYESGSVLVAVQDSGVGFDEKSAAQLFDAFFTTKPQGLGMGLSISRTAIEAYGGRLWATANDGNGATLQFTLPAIDEGSL